MASKPLLTLQVFTFQMLKPSVAQSQPGGAANSSFLFCEKVCSSEQSAGYHKTYEQGSAEKAPITNTPTDREGYWGGRYFVGEVEESCIGEGEKWFY